MIFSGDTCYYMIGLSSIGNCYCYLQWHLQVCHGSEGCHTVDINNLWLTKYSPQTNKQKNRPLASLRLSQGNNIVVSCAGLFTSYNVSCAWILLVFVQQLLVWLSQDPFQQPSSLERTSELLRSLVSSSDGGVQHEAGDKGSGVQGWSPAGNRCSLLQPRRRKCGVCESQRGWCPTAAINLLLRASGSNWWRLLQMEICCSNANNQLANNCHLSLKAQSALGWHLCCKEFTDSPRVGWELCLAATIDLLLWQPVEIEGPAGKPGCDLFLCKQARGGQLAGGRSQAKAQGRMQLLSSLRLNFAW